MIALTEAVVEIVKRAKRLAAFSGRTDGGISKVIFDDTRTLGELSRGRYSVTLNRLLRAERRLTRLEEKTWGHSARSYPRKRQSSGKRKT